ncbi:MAG: VanZ family protein [Acidobacteria bacterium]|nr:VanZ family protein [Acidobacteriota bacterium]MDA1236623.1 VanZ family protein [Acidobacteriota bacterium]
MADSPFLNNFEKTGLRSAQIAAALPWLWLALVVASQSSTAGHLADALFAMLFGVGGPGGGFTHLVLQKGYHVFLFFTFGWLLSLPAAGRSQLSCLLWVFVVGAGAEALQLGAPGRHPQLSDALLNLAAGAAAVVVRARLKRV